MAYNNAIPNATDRLKDSQSQLKDNFAAIFSILGVNHADFNTANQGKHNFVSMPEQGAAPTTLANEMALYTKDVSGVSQMFIRREGNGTEINFTSATLSPNGTTILPSGLILHWGQFVSGGGATANTSVAFSFSTPFPSNCFSCVISTVTAGDNPDGQFLAFLSSFNDAGGSIFWRRLVGLGSAVPRFGYFAIGN